MKPTFCDWDGVPAVLFAHGYAWFVPGTRGHWADHWREVNGARIFAEGRIICWDTLRTVYGGALAAAGRWPEPPPPSPEVQAMIDADEERDKHRSKLRPDLLPRPQPEHTRAASEASLVRFLSSAPKRGRIDRVRACYAPPG